MGLYALTKNWQLSLKDYYFRAIHPRPSRRGILAVFRKKLYEKAIEFSPDWLDAYYYRAHQYIFIDDFQKAEEDFKMVKKLKLSVLEGIVDINKSGDSFEDAITIFDTPMAGAHYEYFFFNMIFGEQGIGWKLNKQYLLQNDNRRFDKLELDLPDGTTKTIYFDITSFYGK